MSQANFVTKVVAALIRKHLAESAYVGLTQTVPVACAIANVILSYVKVATHGKPLLCFVRLTSLFFYIVEAKVNIYFCSDSTAIEFSIRFR